MRSAFTGARLGTTTSTASPFALTTQMEDSDTEDDEDYIIDEDEPEDANRTTSQTIPSAPGELLNLLRQLQEQSAQIERYFPADLPGKAQKLIAWKKQLQRALACAELFDHPQLQEIESQQVLKLRHHLAEATRALDFTIACVEKRKASCAGIKTKGTTSSLFATTS